MTADQLIFFFKRFFLKKRYKIVKRSSVINEWNREVFNTSIGAVMERELGCNLPINDITKDTQFAVVQPCIRFSDFIEISKKSKNGYKLSFFTMLATAKVVSEYIEVNRLVNELVSETYELLLSLGINLNQLKISYFEGGSIEEITQGRVKLKKSFPPDEHTLNAWRKLGIKREQFLPQKKPSRDIFMMSLSGRFYYVGYRSEIFFCPQPDKSKCFEILTLQYYTFKELWENGHIIDVIPANSSLSGLGIGLERMLAALNKDTTGSIFGCSPTNSLYRFLKQFFPDNKASILTDAISSFHIITADSKNHITEMSSSRKEKINKYLNEIYSNFIGLKSQSQIDILRESFKLNAKSYSYYPQLSNCINDAVNETLIYFRKRGINGP